MKFTSLNLTLAASAAILLAGQTHGAEISKADNTSALSLTGSWVGGVVPTATDVAVWDSTVTANRSQAIGGNISFQGLKFTNPGGSLMTISATAGANLTLGGSGIDMSASNADVTITANLTFGASQTFSVASGRALTLTGTGNTGAGNLTLAGPGTLRFNSGSLGQGATPANRITIGEGIRLASDSLSTGRTINNNVTIAGNFTVIKPNSENAMNFANGTVDLGSEIRTISLVDSFSGNQSYSLAIQGNLTTLGTQWIGSGGVRFVNSAESTSARTFVRFGVSANTTAAMNTGVTIGQNVTGVMGSNLGFNLNTRLSLESGGSLKLSNNFVGGSAQAIVVQSLAGTGGNVTSGGNNANALFTINGGALTSRTDFAGQLVDDLAIGNQTLQVSKNGTTTQAFGGNNLYNGRTQINGGTLLINGTHDSSSVTISASTGGWGNVATGNFQVASGATLGGSGRISGTNNSTNSNLVLVQSGGFLAPGDGIGTLTLNGGGLTGGNSTILRMASGSQFNFEIASTGASADRIDLWNFGSGDLLLNSNAVNLSLIGSIAGGTYTVDIFRFYSDSGTTLTTSGLTSGLTVGTLGEGIESASLIYNSAGGLIQLQYTVIPEPSTWALIAFTLITIAAFRSRRLIARRQS